MLAIIMQLLSDCVRLQTAEVAKLEAERTAQEPVRLLWLRMYHEYSAPHFKPEKQNYCSASHIILKLCTRL